MRSVATSHAAGLDVTEFPRKFCMTVADIRTNRFFEDITVEAVGVAHSLEVEHLYLVVASGSGATSSDRQEQTFVGLDTDHCVLLASLGHLGLERGRGFSPDQVDSIKHGDIVEAGTLAKVTTTEEKDVSVDQDGRVRRTRSWDNGTSCSSRGN